MNFNEKNRKNFGQAVRGSLVWLLRVISSAFGVKRGPRKVKKWDNPSSDRNDKFRDQLVWIKLALILNIIYCGEFMGVNYF